MGNLEFFAEAEKIAMVSRKHSLHVGRVPPGNCKPTGMKYGYGSAVEVVLLIALAKQ